MAREVRMISKRDDSGYTITYGKGKRKLEIRLIKRTPTRWQFVNPPDQIAGAHASYAAAKTAFEGYAREVYGEVGDINQPPEQNITRPGPPSFTRKKAEPPQFHRQGDVRSGNRYQCDPLNPDFYTESPDPQITELGVLDEVWRWVQEHINADRHDIFPWANVALVLQRKFPDELKYQEPTLVRGK